MVAQARTLEKALHRRHGAHPPPARLRHIADGYRQAADFFVQHGDQGAARQCLTQAIRLYPELFASREVYLPLPAGSGDLAFVESVLAELAPIPSYNRARRMLRSRVHMSRVFAAARRADMSEVRAHLRAGVSQDPRWLLNRGVWALAARAALGRPSRRRPATPAAGPADRQR